MNAWFEYFTDFGGKDKEDDINERHLAEMRGLLHSVIQDEANKLRNRGGARRVMLVGSSQGGSAAFDAALTWEGSEPLAGVVLLRSLPLGATAQAVVRNPRVRDYRSNVLVISGGADKTFILSLVQRQVRRFRDLAHIRQEVVPRLNHNRNYDKRERVEAANFISSRLGLGSNDAAALTAEADKKSWADLNKVQRRWAKQLGVKGAHGWDSGTSSVWYASWRRLSHAQRRAAEHLGYTAHSWDR
jgi:predicted esterase